MQDLRDAEDEMMMENLFENISKNVSISDTLTCTIADNEAAEIRCKHALTREIVIRK